MNKQHIIEYLDKRWLSLERHLYQFCVSKDPEELHKLRVNTKRVKAVIYLLDSTSKGQKLKQFFDPIQQLYNHAGIIRSVTLNSVYVLKNAKLTSQLKLTLKREINHFCKNESKYLLGILTTGHYYEQRIVSIPAQKIVQFYKDQLKDIHRTLKKGPKPNDLHDVRKKIKRIIYIHELLSPKTKKKVSVHIEYFQDFEDAIGKWNDTITAHEAFSKNKKHSKQALAQIEEESSFAFQQVVELAKKFPTKRSR